MMLWLLAILFSNPANAKNILLVGDSLTCGPLGAAVVRGLATDSTNQMTVYCASNAKPGDWLVGSLPKRTLDQKTLAPTSYYDCKTCAGKSCASWYNGKIPDEHLLESCNKSEYGMGPALRDLLDHKPPYDKVIVSLGTNTLSVSDKVDANYAKVLQLIDEMGIKSCHWIGPPHFDTAKRPGDLPLNRHTAAQIMEGNLKDFYTSLSSVTKKHDCDLIDSRDSTAFPEIEDTTADGVHRKKNSGDHWATAILPRLTGTPPSEAPTTPATR